LGFHQHPEERDMMIRITDKIKHRVAIVLDAEMEELLHGWGIKINPVEFAYLAHALMDDDVETARDIADKYDLIISPVSYAAEALIDALDAVDDKPLLTPAPTPILDFYETDLLDTDIPKIVQLFIDAEEMAL
jgi:hypothetical protein